ncbi:MAG TPA: hypothetical protein QF873_01955 [Patescibacteria group bacterium]|nr:hypothetical protein [Patescibacteria group bacterium]
MTSITLTRWKAVVVILSALMILPFVAFAASSWPSDESVEIGNGFVSEPSGAAVHNDRLWVVDDEGILVVMDYDGSDPSSTVLGGDFEGLTTTDESGDLIYIGVERPDSILEFNTSTNTLTGNAWDLTEFMTGADNQGLEALTYAEGLFYAGMQETGDIYAFKLSGEESVQHVSTIVSPTGYRDLAGLHYDGETFWAAYDSNNIMAALVVDDLVNPTAFSVREEFNMPGNAQEGVAIADRTLFVAQDSGDILMYGNFLPAPAPEPTPEPEPIPEPVLDYSTISTFSIDRSSKVINVEYEGGAEQGIEYSKRRIYVRISKDGSSLYILDGRRFKIYSNGELVFSRKLW